MLRDKVVDEVRAVREQLMAAAGGLDAYVEKIRKMEAAETEPVLQPPPKDERKGAVA